MIDPLDGLAVALRSSALTWLSIREPEPRRKGRTSHGFLNKKKIREATAAGEKVSERGANDVQKARRVAEKKKKISRASANRRGVYRARIQAKEARLVAPLEKSLERGGMPVVTENLLEFPSPRITSFWFSRHSEGERRKKKGLGRLVVVSAGRMGACDGWMNVNIIIG